MLGDGRAVQLVVWWNDDDLFSGSSLGCSRWWCRPCTRRNNDALCFDRSPILERLTVVSPTVNNLTFVVVHQLFWVFVGVLELG